eukprot:Sspe_Gene.21062::Locus_7829_Transcript_1_1_Confidence_1.000_Length_1787::g.21062::m.21062
MAVSDAIGFEYIVVLAITLFLAKYIYSNFLAGIREDFAPGSTTRKGGARRKKKKGGSSAPDDNDVPLSSEETAEDTSKAKKGRKAANVTLKPSKNAAAKAAVEQELRRRDKGEGPASGDDDFQTVVSKKSQSMHKQLTKAVAGGRGAELLRERERRADAQWEHDDKAKHKAPNNPYSLLHPDAPRPVAKNAPLPKKKEPRVVAAKDLAPTPEMLAEMERIRRAAKSVPKAEMEIKVNVQKQWYNLQSLLDTADFEHAPAMLRCYMKEPESCVGGLFITIAGKEWANEHATDELWLVEGWVPPLCKLLDKTAAEVDATVYWSKEGNKQSTVKMRLIEDDEAPLTLQLQHCGASARLSSVIQRVDALDFVGKFLHQLDLLTRFCEKLEDAMEDCIKAGKKTENLEKVQRRLPKSAKVQGLADKLAEAQKTYESGR